MTIKELRERLNEFPDDLRVVQVEYDRVGYDIARLEYVRDDSSLWEFQSESDTPDQFRPEAVAFKTT